MTYRDDRDAMYHRLQESDREVDDLRRQNVAMRRQIEHQQRMLAAPRELNAYKQDLSLLTEEQRATLAFHRVQKFPVWAMPLLTLVTFGLFPFIRLSLEHDNLPLGAHNDPSAGKAIGFTFIPYFNLYWVFFNSLRLCDRIDLQYRLRGEEPKAPKGLAIACSIISIVPYLNIVLGIPMWAICSSFMQKALNGVADFDPHDWGQPRELTDGT